MKITEQISEELGGRTGLGPQLTPLKIDTDQDKDVDSFAGWLIFHIFFHFYNTFRFSFLKPNWHKDFGFYVSI